MAELLARRFGDLDPLLAASREELEQVPGIGPAIAESVARFFADPQNAAEVKRFREAGVRWPAAQPALAPSGPLAGKSFVLSGGLASMTRAEAKRRIEQRGGRVAPSVSKQTDYLVVGLRARQQAREGAAARASRSWRRTPSSACSARPPPPPPDAVCVSIRRSLRARCARSASARA